MVIFFDIDGTIIDAATQIIPDSAVRAVERLKENGHVPIINTGRPYLQIDHRIKKMAFRGFACGCGMEVLLDGEYLTRVQPPLELRRRSVECSRKYHMVSFYETMDGGILLDGENSFHPLMSREVERLRRAGYPIHQLAEEGEPDFMKFVTFCGESGDIDAFKAEMSRDYVITDRESGMYELVLKGYSKAAGMMRILSHLGTAPEDTCAIGDSANDIPMFRMAAHSACMGGGAEEAMQAAEFVTAPVLEDGIEKALKHFGLI